MSFEEISNKYEGNEALKSAVERLKVYRKKEVERKNKFETQKKQKDQELAVQIKNNKTEIKERDQNFMASLAEYVGDTEGDIRHTAIDFLAENRVRLIRELRDKFGTGKVEAKDAMYFIADFFYNEIKDIPLEERNTSYIISKLSDSRDSREFIRYDPFFRLFRINKAEKSLGEIIEDRLSKSEEEKEYYGFEGISSQDAMATVLGLRYQDKKIDLANPEETDELILYLANTFVGERAEKHMTLKLKAELKYAEIQRKENAEKQYKNDQGFNIPRMNNSPTIRRMVELSAMERIIDLVYSPRTGNIEKQEAMDFFNWYFGQDSKVVTYYEKVQKGSDKWGRLLRSVPERKARKALQKLIHRELSEGKISESIQSYYNSLVYALNLFKSGLQLSRNTSQPINRDQGQVLMVYAIQLLEKLEVDAVQMEVAYNLEGATGMIMGESYQADLMQSLQGDLLADLPDYIEAHKELLADLDGGQGELDAFDRRLEETREEVAEKAKEAVVEEAV